MTTTTDTARLKRYFIAVSGLDTNLPKIEPCESEEGTWTRYVDVTPLLDRLQKAEADHQAALAAARREERVKALEEAARLCEAIATDDSHEGLYMQSRRAEDCAQKIRALSEHLCNE